MTLNWFWKVKTAKHVNIKFVSMQSHSMMFLWNIINKILSINVWKITLSIMLALRIVFIRITTHVKMLTGLFIHVGSGKDYSWLDEQTDLNNILGTIMINQQPMSCMIEHVVREWWNNKIEQQFTVTTMNSTWLLYQVGFARLFTLILCNDVCDSSLIILQQCYFLS